jgi:hypothetical protein
LAAFLIVCANEAKNVVSLILSGSKDGLKAAAHASGDSSPGTRVARDLLIQMVAFHRKITVLFSPFIK